MLLWKILFVTLCGSSKRNIQEFNAIYPLFFSISYNLRFFSAVIRGLIIFKVCCAANNSPAWHILIADKG